MKSRFLSLFLFNSLSSQRRGSLQVVAMKKDINPKYNTESKVKKVVSEERKTDGLRS